MASEQGDAYLSAGREAVAYAKSKLKYGAANNPLKLQSSLWSQLRAMAAILKVWHGEDDEMDLNYVNPVDGLRVAQTYAHNAEKYGAGNCGEHSATAYMWLRRKGVFPIDWVHFRNKDHAFVLIGRSSKGSYNAEQIPEQPWFADSVVCDAYWGRCEFWSTVFDQYKPSNILPICHQEEQNEIHQWINK